MSETQPTLGQALAMDQIQKILDASHPDPFSFLGLHAAQTSTGPSWVVRTFRPHAQRLWVLANGERYEADRVDADGFLDMAPRFGEPAGLSA